MYHPLPSVETDHIVRRAIFAIAHVGARDAFAIPTQGQNVERNGSNYFQKSPNDLHIIARFLDPGMPHVVQESVRLSVAR